MEKDIGRIRKNDNTEIVVRIDDFGGKKGLTVREYVTSDRYTGYTKQGTRIPAEKFAEFKKLIESVDEKDLKQEEVEKEEEKARTEEKVEAEAVEERKEEKPEEPGEEQPAEKKKRKRGRKQKTLDETKEETKEIEVSGCKETEEIAE